MLLSDWISSSAEHSIARKINLFTMHMSLLHVTCTHVHIVVTSMLLLHCYITPLIPYPLISDLSPLVRRIHLPILPLSHIIYTFAHYTGVYFVPAFAGLFAPYWRGDARGVIAGLTAFNTKVYVGGCGNLFLVIFGTRKSY